MKQIVLAIDVMGGDHGPETTVQGVIMASKIYPNVKFKLFGDKAISEPELKKMNGSLNYEFVHTKELIKSDDEPVNALRKLNHTISVTDGLFSGSSFIQA